jgi:hypothetical protein
MKIFLTVAVSLMPLLAIAADQKEFAAADLQRVVDDIAAATLQEFAGKNLATNQLAITLVNLGDTKRRIGTYRGEAQIYPASVVKLFYLAASHRWLEDGKLKDGTELRRAMKDMIVESSNDATHHVLDVLTDTTSGPELPPAEMKAWGEKRNAVNRYFASLGYTNINASQKTWCEGPYGRERMWLGEKSTNRNALTTDATARLLTEIVLGQCVTPERSAEMMKLLSRDRSLKTSDSDNQTHGFTGIGLPADAKLWSKAGWTSTTRHDAAYVELSDGRKFILVTFTTNHANDRDIIAFVARQVVARL